MNYQEIADCAYELEKEIDKLWNDNILISSGNCDYNRGYFVTDNTYCALECLARNASKFKNLVLALIAEVRTEEELQKEIMIHCYNARSVLKTIKPVWRTNTASADRYEGAEYDCLVRVTHRLVDLILKEKNAPNN